MIQRASLLWSEAPAHLLEAVFHSSTTAGIVVDVQNNVCLLNEAAIKMTGYTADEAVGRNAAFLVPEHQDKDAFKDILHRLECGQNFGPVETVILHKNGNPVPVAINYFGARGDNGALIGVVKAARPLSLTEHEERFRVVVEASPSGMMIVDPEGKIVMVNSRIESLCNYSRQELIGRQLEFLAPERFLPTDKISQPQPGEFLDTPWADALSQGEELFVKRKDGGETPVEIGFNRINLDHDDYMLISMLDLTERKRSEGLEADRDQALKLSNMKSAFVANISHELRTPLSGILGMNELLLGSELDEEQREIAIAIKDSAQALLRIVNDVLDIAKIEAGKVALSSEKMNVGDVVSSALRLVSEAARAKSVKLESTVDERIPAYLVGDPERIKQILLNLLGNAIKFTAEGSVTLDVTVEQSDNNKMHVRFSVRDTGVGMAPEKLKELFRPFSQVAETYTGRALGTGLGLSISKTLVEAMNGEIGVDSTRGTGSVFWFAIPLTRYRRDAAQTASGQFINAETAVTEKLQREEVTTSGAPVVLLVEDSPLLRVLAIKQLEKLGVKAHIVGSGMEAVDIIKTRQFDLILMDINIPDLDGLETTRRIRDYENALSRHTPIVAMTAAAMQGDLERCMESGMDDYLRKPVTLDELKKKLETFKLLST